jgi:hypothetical protein
MSVWTYTSSKMLVRTVKNEEMQKVQMQRKKIFSKKNAYQY